MSIDGERVARLEEKVDGLTGKIDAIHDDLHMIGKTFDKVWDAVERLRDQFHGRPSWAVTTLITVLTALLVAACSAIVALLT